MTEERYTRVSATFRARVSTQSYGGRTRIDGIKFLNLSLFGDEGGDFCDIARVADDGTLVAFPDTNPSRSATPT
jgi:hypothetical protein